jgi:hypothetical protein
MLKITTLSDTTKNIIKFFALWAMTIGGIFAYAYLTGNWNNLFQ